MDALSDPLQITQNDPQRMNLPSQAMACLTLCRPLNCAITAASACVGALTAGTWPLTGAVVSAALSAAAVTGAGNAFNDLIDVDIDRINRPRRPLPAGRIVPRTAAATALTLAGTGLCLAGLVSWAHALTAAVVMGVLIVYSLALKRRPMWGNLAVAALAAVVFPYGAAAVGNWGRSWIPAGFAFLYHLGREIVKDIEDLSGDRARQADTLAVRWGVRPAALTATGVFFVLVGFTSLPAALAIYGLPYTVLVSGLDLLIIGALARLHWRPEATADGRVGAALKVGMLVGLAAVVLGELAR